MTIIAIVSYIIAGSIVLVGGYAVWSGLKDAHSIGKQNH